MLMWQLSLSLSLSVRLYTCLSLSPPLSNWITLCQIMHLFKLLRQCLLLCVHACVCVIVCVCMYMCVCVCVCVVYARAGVSVCVRACVYLLVCKCVLLSTFVHAQVYVCVFALVYLHVTEYVCVCAYEAFVHIFNLFTNMVVHEFTLSTFLCLL